MIQELFRLKYGVIPACDVNTIQEFEDIIKDTSSVPGIVGYKIGAILALEHGLPCLAQVARKHTDFPLIYDHQKAGTDIPDMASRFALVCARNGVAGFILFPHAGPATEIAFIQSVLDAGLVPIVGGEMTHPQFLQAEGGFILDSGPEQMFRIATNAGVSAFVLPGKRVHSIQKYATMLGETVQNPIFMMPGIGRQGGDIQKAFEATGGHASYAIIGSSIYKSGDMQEAASRFCEVALQFDKSQVLGINPWTCVDFLPCPANWAKTSSPLLSPRIEDHWRPPQEAPARSGIAAERSV